MGRELDESHDPLADFEVDDHVEDDVLRLMFMACHPVLPREARVALALKTLTGLSTEEIARAFLVPTSTMAQRIVRAKRTLKDNAGARSRCRSATNWPSASGRCSRSSTSCSTRVTPRRPGDTWARAELCEEAMRLGRILAALAPSEPEAHGLVALMEIQASRLARLASERPARSSRCSTRTARAGTALLITHAFAALDRARARRRRAAGGTCCRPRSPPATRERRGPRTPTGCGSRRCTACSRRSHRRPSSS